MPTWKKSCGHHPLAVFADHGPDGSAEPLAVLLRAGNAGSNTAADHIEAARLALAQLRRHLRRRVLIRTACDAEGRSLRRPSQDHESYRLRQQCATGKSRP